MPLSSSQAGTKLSSSASSYTLSLISQAAQRHLMIRSLVAYLWLHGPNSLSHLFLLQQRTAPRVESIGSVPFRLEFLFFRFEIYPFLSFQ